MAWRAASYAKPGFPRSRHHNRFLDARDDCILLSRASVCLLPCTLGKHTMYIQCSLITTHHHRGSAHATPPDLAITVDTAVARLLTVRQEAPVRGVVLRLSTSATLPLCRRRHVIAPRWKFLLESLETKFTLFLGLRGWHQCAARTTFFKSARHSSYPFHPEFS